MRAAARSIKIEYCFFDSCEAHRKVCLFPVTRKYVVTSHNLSCSVLDIPTNFHQDIDNHLKGGYSYLIINTLQVIIKNRGEVNEAPAVQPEEILMDTLWREKPSAHNAAACRKSYGSPLEHQLYRQIARSACQKRHGAGQRSAAERTLSVAAVRPLLHQGRISGEHARGARREPGTVCPNRRGAVQKPAKSNESEQEEKLIAELEKMVDQYEAALQNKEEK